MTAAGGVLLALLATAPAAAKDIAIHAGRLLDVTGKVERGQSTILIHDDRITAVQDGFTAPAGAEVVDLSNATVLPGLIDVHVHIGGGEGQGSRFRDTYVNTAFYAAANALKKLNAGFTAVRNVGSSGGVDLALRDAVKKGLVPGPRVWASAEPLSPTGGHGDAGNELNPDLSLPHWRDGVVDGADEVIKAVRDHKKRGVDLIKIMPSGGVNSTGDDPQAQLMTNEEIKAAIDTAHSLGMKVAAHAHGTDAINNSVRLGVASIEHGTYANAETYRLMKEHGTYFVPTMANNATNAALAREHPERFNPGSAAKILEIAPLKEKMLHDAYAAGVKIAMGSDRVGDDPVRVDAREFYYMVKAGMTPMDAVLSATVNAADLIGSDKIGSIQPGRFADIIAVAGDPLKDVTELERVRFVMKGGVVYKPWTAVPAAGTTAP